MMTASASGTPSAFIQKGKSFDPITRRDVPTPTCVLPMITAAMAAKTETWNHDRQKCELSGTSLHRR